MATKRKAKPPLEMTALETLVVEKIPLGNIAPNNYNPNWQPDREFLMLLQSIRDDGFTRPVIVQGEPNEEGQYTIVDGEHRWTGLIVFETLRAWGVVWDEKGEALDFDEVLVQSIRKERLVHLAGVAHVQCPVVKVTMPSAQAQLATLRHNRARGSEDQLLAASVVRDLERLGVMRWAKDALLLGQAEIDRALKDVDAASGWAKDEMSEGWEPMKDASLISEEFRQELVDRSARRQEATDVKEYVRETFAPFWNRPLLRLGGTVSGPEYTVIREAMGETPHDALITMTRAYLDHGDGSVPPPDPENVPTWKHLKAGAQSDADPAEAGA